jgi:hypothetical protein
MVTHRAWLLVAIVSVAVRAGAMHVYDTATAPPHFENHDVAESLWRGQGFVYAHLGTVYRSYIEPLYVFVTYVVYALTDRSFVAMAIVNGAIAAAVPLAAAKLAATAFGLDVGLVAGLLVALDPALIRYAVVFHPVSLDALLMTAVVAAVVTAAARPTVPAHVALGVLSGLCVLTRPTIGAFLPLAAAWLLGEDRTRRRLALVAIAAGTAALIAAPWVVRNYAVHGAFMLTRSNGPFVLWLGNHPGATGTSATADGISLFDVAPADLRARVLGTKDEIEQNVVFRDEALAYIRRDPWAFAGRVGAKLMRFWSVPQPVGTPVGTLSLTAYRVFYAVVLAFALVGIWVARRQHVTLLAVGFLVTISLVQSVYYVEGRHRMVVEPVLLVFTAVGLLAALARAFGQRPLSLTSS